MRLAKTKAICYNLACLGTQNNGMIAMKHPAPFACLDNTRSVAGCFLFAATQKKPTLARGRVVYSRWEKHREQL